LRFLECVKNCGDEVATMGRERQGWLSSNQATLRIYFFLLFVKATDEAHHVKNPAAVALGRLGGLKGEDK